MENNDTGAAKAANVETLVRDYRRRVGGANDLEMDLGDLIADILHYASVNGIDPDHVIGAGEHSYESEV